MKELIGKQVNSLFISNDGKNLLFMIDGGEVLVYGAFGDCCAAVWFSDISGEEALFNKPIINIRVLELPEEDADNIYDFLEVYGIQLETLSGRCTIEYRNSHNGSYGGYDVKLIKDIEIKYGLFDEESFIPFKSRPLPEPQKE